jgi:hypothetical protein
MAEYKIAEFAKLVGKEPKQIHRDISRTKLIKNESKKIDTSNIVNSEYLQLNRIDLGQQNAQNTPSKNVKSTKREKQPPPSPLQKATLEQKQLAVSKAKRELELQDIIIKEKLGELINKSETLRTVTSYVDSLKRELDHKLQLIIQDFGVRHSIEITKTEEFKAKVPIAINESSEASIKLLLKQFGDE